MRKTDWKLKKHFSLSITKPTLKSAAVMKDKVLISGMEWQKSSTKV